MLRWNCTIIDTIVDVLSHVSTQSLFDTKKGMMQTFPTSSENGYGPATPLRYTEYVWKVLKSSF